MQLGVTDFGFAYNQILSYGNLTANLKYLNFQSGNSTCSFGSKRLLTGNGLFVPNANSVPATAIYSILHSNSRKSSQFSFTILALRNLQFAMRNSQLSKIYNSQFTIHLSKFTIRNSQFAICNYHSQLQALNNNRCWSRV